jgi:hypothetical protein
MSTSFTRVGVFLGPSIRIPQSPGGLALSLSPVGGSMLKSWRGPAFS